MKTHPHPTSDSPAAPRRMGLAVPLISALMSGCTILSVAGSVAGAAIDVTSTVVTTGVKVTGKVVGLGVDALSNDKPAAPASTAPTPPSNEPPRAAPAPAASPASTPEAPAGQ